LDAPPDTLKLDEIFSDYQPRQLSALNRRPRNVGSIQTTDAAESPRSFNLILVPAKA